MSLIGRIGLTRILTATVLLTLTIAGRAAQAAPAQQAGQTVQIVDFEFKPKILTVPVGTKVTWINNGASTHTATSDTGVFDSGDLAKGASASFTFDTAGTFPYFCKFHGSAGGGGMSGTIEVTATQAPAPTATTAPAEPSPTTAPASPAPTATTAPAPAPAAPAPSVKVSNQPLVDDSISVDEVVAAQDGWIAVHTNTVDNKPGPVIGFAPVKTGTNTNVKIKLSPAPRADDKLWPMLHIDAGTIGTYEFPGPDAPAIVDGTIIMMQMTVTGVPAPVAPIPSLKVSDQPLVDDSISVDEVVAAQDGWIAVHTNTVDNKPGPVIGFAPVKTGTNTNVKIKLSPPPNVGDKLWPMLHIDVGILGTYEFPGPDAPVIVNGTIIMMQMTVTGSTVAVPVPAPAPVPTPLPPAPTTPVTLPNTGMTDGATALITGLALLALAAGLGIRRGLRRRVNTR